jgi:hypothetical protein
MAIIRRRMSEAAAAGPDAPAPRDILGMALATPPEEGAENLDVQEVRV